MLGFVVFIFVFWTASIFCCEILGPFVTAARKYRRISKLYVCDLFSLTFLLALPLAIGAIIREEHWGIAIGENGKPLIAGIIISFILLYLFAYAWWRGAVALSSMGIVHSGRRCLFLGVLMPVAILGSTIGLPVLGVTACDIPSMSMMEMAAWILGVLITPILAWCCRKETFWVLSDPNIFPAEEPKKTPTDLIDATHFP